ncbi:DivIVA domain-containing protein [Allosalinactinospora lopnorensis]|uniref:DivIVA domain-containing protein n=1 Tax=Allosalinactinospora lopnorensis TaxID=1352348 RepID=UPI000623FAB6|nr:DivIVA domain-containing protein [Allosalinactinospora lopnorensis]
MGLTPADIRNKKFRTVRLQTGYNEQDVDALLDRVEATIAALQGGPLPDQLITAEEVMASRFRSTKLATGYHEDDVDEFLDDVAADLRRHGLGTVADRPAPGTLPDPPSLRRTRGMDFPPPPPPAPEPPSGEPTMRPEDVRNRKFATTRLTTGYNEQEVDEFLDSAEATLKALLNGHPEVAPLTSVQVERVRFATTRARPGYDPTQVDAFLDELCEELRRYEAH